MNKWIGIGRLTADPEVRYSTDANGNQTAIARYRLAVDRKFKREGEQQTADFLPCVAFGKNGEFAEKYLKKGMKIAVEGRIQTGSYTNKDNQKVYTTDIVVEAHDFCESKGSSGDAPTPMPTTAEDAGFMSIPDGLENDLPFK